MPEDFTPAQLARQVEKIRQALFDDFEDMGEGKWADRHNHKMAFVRTIMSTLAAVASLFVLYKVW